MNQLSKEKKDRFILGSIWMSCSGSDAGRFYLLAAIQANRLFLWDGKRHRTNQLKPKNPAHCCWIAPADEESDSLIRKSQRDDLSDQARLELDARVRRILSKKRSAHVQRGCH